MKFIVMILSIFVLFFSSFMVHAKTPAILDAESRAKEEEQALQMAKELAKYYQLDNNATMREVTQEVLESPLVKDKRKEDILQYGRRIFVFEYPSDGLRVKGLISFVPDAEHQPTMVFVRGGNKTFGMPNPGADYMNPRKYTVITMTYRDGVSEGTDEFGGNDVNDVKNLIAFLPTLESQLNIKFQQENMFLMGFSRGGMQMFLALGRYPNIQDRFAKIVALTGVLDVRVNASQRPDMREMFIEEFGLQPGVNEDEWFEHRNPISMAQHIKSDLPILIIHGDEDNRIAPEEGLNMFNELCKYGKQVTYWEIAGGTHGLLERPNRLDPILDWFEGP